MQFNSQKDPRWKNNSIGGTPYTIGRYGCKLTCYSMILGTTPDVIASHKEYFDLNALLIDDEKCASDFGGKFNTERSVALQDPVVIDTRFDGSQHFVVRYQGRIYDPLSLDGTPLRNYQVIGYRNISKEDSMDESTNAALRQCQIDLGNRQASLLEAQSTCNVLQTQVSDLVAQVENLKAQVKILTDTNTKLQKKIDILTKPVNNYPDESGGLIQGIIDWFNKLLK